MFRCFRKFVFTEFLTTWVRVEIIMFDSRMVTISIFWSYSLHFFCLHLTQFILSTNYVCKQITNHGRQFPEAKIIKLGLEHYDYVTSCGNNNVWHNDNDHACLPSRVLNMEGVDLLLALFIRLWFFSNIYYDFLIN